jgi:ribosome biogenesis GTPase
MRAIICINKIDLGERDKLQPVIDQYVQLRYPVVLTNANTEEGIPELRHWLRNRETVLTGQSGVGKSSLLNVLHPQLGQAVGVISRETRKGRHTTRVTELFPLPEGGWIVDTPGIRQLQLWDLSRAEVEGCFSEFEPFVAECRFPNCTHTHEQHCGVKEAVAQDRISPLRYASYVRIVAGT